MESPTHQHPNEASAVPQELAKLADQPRILVRRPGAPRRNGKCVVYWMQRAMRILDNPALDVAINAANLLNLPVVVYFSAAANGSGANLRHARFIGEALRDVAEQAAERGLGFVLSCDPTSSLESFFETVEAALLIGDENPCREPERRRQVLARGMRIPYWTVDADVVVPSRVFGRDYFLLHHFRPHLKRALPEYLVPAKNLQPVRPWHALPHSRVPEDIASAFRRLDGSVKPVDTFTGGTRAALQRLRQFVDHDLADYESLRNKPEHRGTSRLSPYLHFGNISPVTIALQVESAFQKGRVTAATRDRFFDELIGWRELAVLFVRYKSNYDNWECAEPWARETLLQHAGDPRPARYTLEQLERAQTHDDLWNAGQLEMVQTGWMHNTMRMYWAKKILEWAPDPATAFDWAVLLNDKYQLDGRDPNGYAGIAWAIVGKHDRPWFDRPIIGMVRSMTAASTGRKFNADTYIRQNRPSGSIE